MDQEPIFQPSTALAKHAHIDAKGYAALYADSIADPDAFWTVSYTHLTLPTNREV